MRPMRCRKFSVPWARGEIDAVEQRLRARPAMTLPSALKNTLAVPAIGAPMFLVSFPPLVTAQCLAGVIGAFPHVNARPSEQLDQWLTKIEADLRDYKAAHPAARVAPHAVNLIVHR